MFSKNGGRVLNRQSEGRLWRAAGPTSIAKTRWKDLHASTTSPDARRYRAAGRAKARGRHCGHGLMQNRHDRLADACLMLAGMPNASQRCT